MIDDDAALRDCISLALTGIYRITTHASAQEGVDALNEDICAVILDVKMKGHDGFWARNEIRKKNPQLPVIFYSAYQDAKDPYPSTDEYSPFGYLVKDGDIDKLLTVVEKAVKSYKLDCESRKLLDMLRKSQSRSR